MKKPAYQVLIGNCEDALNEIGLLVLEQVLQGAFELKVTKTAHLAGLVEKSANQEFDLCLLVLNNIMVPELPSNSHVQTRIHRVLDFIASLKAKHRTPVIAFS